MKQESRLIRYLLFPLFWAAALGAAGFISGFIGPMVFNPDANQGPMLGLFVTGPGGFFLGVVIGFICAKRRMAWQQQIIVFGITAVVGGGGILLFCLLSALP